VGDLDVLTTCTGVALPGFRLPPRRWASGTTTATACRCGASANARRPRRWSTRALTHPLGG